MVVKFDQKGWTPRDKCESGNVQMKFEGARKVEQMFLLLLEFLEPGPDHSLLPETLEP